MTNPLEYIRQHPKLAKQLIGLNLPELEKLIQQAIALDEQRKKELEKRKIRLNKKGGGRSRKLLAEVEIYLTLEGLKPMSIYLENNKQISLSHKVLQEIKLISEPNAQPHLRRNRLNEN